MDSDYALVDEPARLSALNRLGVLDSPPEKPFDDIVSLVRTVLGVPMAAVTLISEDRQWLKARSGVAATETPRDVSFCTHTIRQRMPMIVSDAHQDTRFSDNPLVLGEPNIRSYAGVPLCTADGYNVGALCAIDVKPRDYSEGDLAILSNLARIVMNELELRQIAERDQLTWAFSRRGFMNKAEQDMARFARYERPSVLAMIDVDHFKAVNDTHGHPAGDLVLRELAGVITVLKRPSDVLGRLGGEEFALLLPETEEDAAFAACERLRQSIASREVELAAGQRIRITASFGIAPLTRDYASPEQWIAAADEPLYAAKRAGRNRCQSRIAPRDPAIRLFA